MPDHSIQPSMPRVLILSLQQPGCYVCISGALSNPEPVGHRWYLGHEEHIKDYEYPHKQTKANISFTYVEDGVAAEWDGEHGPIQLWFKADPPTAQSPLDYAPDAPRPHWLWPFATGAGAWSQLAVSRANLPEKFNAGDYNAIFAELRSWVQTHLRRKEEK